MGAPFILPEDDNELEKLILEHGQAEVARMYGVTRGAVAARVARAHERGQMRRIQPRRDYSKYIPWTLDAKHKNHDTAKKLRIYGALQEGWPVTADEERRLRTWMGLLDSDGLVFAYDRSEGFYRVPRQPEDVGYIRQPEPSSGK